MPTYVVCPHTYDKKITGVFPDGNDADGNLVTGMYDYKSPDPKHPDPAPTGQFHEVEVVYVVRDHKVLFELDVIYTPRQEDNPIGTPGEYDQKPRIIFENNTRWWNNKNPWNNKKGWRQK